MRQDLFRNKVRRMVSECAYNEMRRVVREEVIRALNEELFYEEEDDKKSRPSRASKGDGKGKKTSDSVKRKNVMNMLRNPKLKDSEIMRDLWHVKPGTKEDDTKRSLFSKKVSGEPDADGNVRTFTNDEINRLFNILSNT